MRYMTIYLCVVWPTLFFGPILSITSWDAENIQEIQRREGTLFLRKGDILLSGDTWTLTLDLSFKAYQWAAQTIIDETEKFMNWLQSTVIPYPIFNADSPANRDEGRRFPDPILHHYHEEAVHLRSRARKLINYVFQLQQVSAIHEVSDSIPRHKPWEILGWTPKSKRGVIDLGGKALKWLFGVATDEDLEKLSQKIDELHADKNDLLHLMQEQASVLNISASNIKKNREDINLIIDIMKNLTGETHALKKQVNNTSWSLWRSLVSTEHIQISLRRVNVALLELQNEVTSLLQALETTAQRRLSPYLISPNQLFQILQNITLKLPGDLTLAVPLSPDSTFMYYHWADVKTIALDNQLRMFVTIPLKTFDRSYDLFQIVPIPVRIEGTPLALIRNPKVEFLAISSDRQSFLELNIDDLAQCFSGPFVVCRPKSAIRVRPATSCSYELFLDNPNPKSCEKQLLTHNEPKFFRLSKKGIWFYISPYPLRLSVQCPTQDQVLNTYETQEHELKFSGVLYIPASCSAHAPGYLLPSSYAGHLDIKIMQHVDLEIPNVFKMLNDSQITLFQKAQDHTRFNSILQNLQKIQENKLQPVGVPIAEIEAKIMEMEKEGQSAKPIWQDWWNPKSIPTPMSLIWAIFIVTGVVWLLRRYSAKRSFQMSEILPSVFQGRGRSTVAPERRLTPAPQRKSEGEEVELRVMTEDDDESC